MANIMKMMKQVSSMQKNMAKAQEELAATEVAFSSGGGAVTVRAHGDGRVCGISISPEVLKDGDASLLEDLILTAVVGAQEKAQELSAQTMNKLTAGLNLPPGFGI